VDRPGRGFGVDQASMERKEDERNKEENAS
jgi:hypothetical protein